MVNYPKTRGKKEMIRGKGKGEKRGEIGNSCRQGEKYGYPD